MKKELLNIFFLLTLILLSCESNEGSRDVVKESNTEKFTSIQIREWKELRCGLYMNDKGELGFPSAPSMVLVPESELGDTGCPNTFLTKFGSNDSTQLKNIIDTSSFEGLGANYYRDNNHIYVHYTMCDGGYFNIFSDNTTGFEVLGNSAYAKHNSKIYHCRAGQLDADPTTFEVFDEFSQIAKDKNGYFAFQDRISEQELKASLGDELFLKLKKSEK